MKLKLLLKYNTSLMYCVKDESSSSILSIDAPTSTTEPAALENAESATTRTVGNQTASCMRLQYAPKLSLDVLINIVCLKGAPADARLTC